MPPEAPLFQSSIHPPGAGTMEAVRTGEEAAGTWRRIDEALWPIIGHAGMAALFKRSLYLARADHPCFATVLEARSPPSDFAELRATLAQQADAEATAAHAGLLRIFIDLLTISSALR